MRSDEELLKEIESQDFDPNAGKTYTKKEDVQLIVAHLEQLSAQKRVNEAVAAARKSGTTWGTIGNILRMSKQDAQQKYGTAKGEKQ